MYVSHREKCKGKLPINFIKINQPKITEDIIEYIKYCAEKDKSAYVYVAGELFDDDFLNLPNCVDRLEINIKSNQYIQFKNNIIKHIPKSVTHLTLYDSMYPIDIPSHIKILELSDRYLDKFPDILNIIPYGIENIYINHSNKHGNLNLNTLPESIEYIHINAAGLNNIEFNIILDKYLPKLKYIKYNHYHITNHEEILEYLKKYYN
jgi:hypothetical protein